MAGTIEQEYREIIADAAANENQAPPIQSGWRLNSFQGRETVTKVERETVDGVSVVKRVASAPHVYMKASCGICRKEIMTTNPEQTRVPLCIHVGAAPKELVETMIRAQEKSGQRKKPLTLLERIAGRTEPVTPPLNSF